MVPGELGIVMECRSRAGRGPGTPYYSDATEVLKAAVLRRDAGDALSMAALVAASRPKDGLTLWHLISQTEGEADWWRTWHQTL